MISYVLESNIITNADPMLITLEYTHYSRYDKVQR